MPCSIHRLHVRYKQYVKIGVQHDVTIIAVNCSDALLTSGKNIIRTFAYMMLAIAKQIFAVKEKDFLRIH